jgi:hypothetical protein
MCCESTATKVWLCGSVSRCGLAETGDPLMVVLAPLSLSLSLTVYVLMAVLGFLYFLKSL